MHKCNHFDGPTHYKYQLENKNLEILVIFHTYISACNFTFVSLYFLVQFNQQKIDIYFQQRILKDIYLQRIPNSVKYFAQCATEWTFVLLLTSLSLMSTPLLFQLLLLPVAGQAFTVPNILITLGTILRNSKEHYTPALAYLLCQRQWWNSPAG